MRFILSATLTNGDVRYYGRRDGWDGFGWVTSPATALRYTSLDDTAAVEGKWWMSPTATAATIIEATMTQPEAAAVRLVAVN